MGVPVTVKSELEVRVDDLPPRALEMIKAALTLPNEDRETQQREQIPGWWNLPESMAYWRVERFLDGDRLYMPRGFARYLGMGLTELGSEIEWIDKRTERKADQAYFQQFLLRDYQLEAVIDMIKAHQGFYQCPAGGGKTVTMLGLCALLGQRALVVVDKADLVEQWRERACQFLSLDDDFESTRSAGKIGQDVWEERDLTIALRQTLWSRKTELDATKWWEDWGLTIFDEGHHLASETVAAISRCVTSKWAIGTSATPARTPTKGLIVGHLIGPIVHETPRKLLRERGILIKPEVRQVLTDFETPFWVTQTIGPEDECPVPGCKKVGKKHQHRNNYSSVQKKLVEDSTRLEIVADQVVSERGHIHLLPSRQLKHLDLLKAAIVAAGWDGPIHYLRGEENARGISREIVASIKEADEAVILSTVADEALDVPPIDRVHISFPMRQEAATEQLVGRCERAWPGKDHAIVYDYVDHRMEVFMGQATQREETYRRLGYAVQGRREAVL